MLGPGDQDAIDEAWAVMGDPDHALWETVHDVLPELLEFDESWLSGELPDDFFQDAATELYQRLEELDLHQLCFFGRCVELLEQMATSDDVGEMLELVRCFTQWLGHLVPPPAAAAPAGLSPAGLSPAGLSPAGQQ